MGVAQAQRQQVAGGRGGPQGSFFGYYFSHNRSRAQFYQVKLAAGRLAQVDDAPVAEGTPVAYAYHYRAASEYTGYPQTSVERQGFVGAGVSKPVVALTVRCFHSLEVFAVPRGTAS